jgi:hypothetical protein
MCRHSIAKHSSLLSERTRIRKIGLILRLAWLIFPDGLREETGVLRQFETLRFVNTDELESEG